MTDLDADGVLREFREYLKIDKTGLEEAMAQQADLFFRVSEEYELAVSLREEAKEKLATVDSDLGINLRGSDKKEKPTEGQIKDMVQSHTRHRAAHEHWANCRRRAARLLSLKEAFQERGRMLRDLGNLYATGYFTTIASKGAASTVGREKLRQARNGNE